MLLAHQELCQTIMGTSCPAVKLGGSGWSLVAVRRWALLKKNIENPQKGKLEQNFTVYAIKMLIKRRFLHFISCPLK